MGGSRYGPQLNELNHTCDSSCAAYPLVGWNINTSIDARVIKEKLLLRGFYRMSISLSGRSSVVLDSQVEFSQNIPDPDGLMASIDQFGLVGCVHTRDTLPAIVMNALHWQLDNNGGQTRSLDLLNCGYCATDLRVRVELDCGSTCAQIEVEIWQSFGGRVPGDRDEAENAHFLPYGRNWEQSFDINRPPDRNLEEMFQGGIKGDCNMFCSSDQARRRQSWIQLWQWHYHRSTAHLYRCRKPSDDDGTSNHIQGQALPLLCV